MIYTKLNNKWSSVLPKILSAKSDEKVDQLLKEYYDYRTEIGYDKFNAYVQSKVTENRKKMGLE